MSVKKQFEAERKCFAVIDSCRTINQRQVAKQYVENYRSLFNDSASYIELINYISNKTI